MGFFNKQKKQNSGYIFLSHSHGDIEKVRKIRNALEKDGFEPLCFYLKCLDDEAEIEDLIKREIDAREWFVFANSENARNSKWVTLEREYIARTNRKKIITVNIDDERSVAHAVYKISHNLRVFVAHTGVDYPVAKEIRNKLREKDYIALTVADALPVGTAFWKRGVRKAIVDASRDGCVLLLLSERSVQSAYVKYMAAYTLRKGGNIIPVMLGNEKLDEDYRRYLHNRQIYHMSVSPTEEELEQLVENIGFRIMEL